MNFRIGKQRLRDSRIQVIDYLTLLLAGACLGPISDLSNQSFGVYGYPFTIIAVCKLPILCEHMCLTRPLPVVFMQYVLFYRGLNT